MLDSRAISVMTAGTVYFVLGACLIQIVSTSGRLAAP